MCCARSCAVRCGTGNISASPSRSSICLSTCSRAQSAFGGGKKGDDFAVSNDALKGIGDEFEGYTATRVAGVPVIAMFDAQRQPVDALSAGAKGYIALARTPFYLEAGGQVSDSGRIFSEAGAGSADVEGLARIAPGLPRAHR